MSGEQKSGHSDQQVHDKLDVFSFESITSARRGEGMNVGGPGSWPIKGLSLVSCTSSAREHQHDDEAGGDNCGLQIQREREVGGCIEEGEEITHPAIPVG
jgi:hypothetical protein